MIHSKTKTIKITDTTLRDGHQCLWATRMRLEDIVPIAEYIDKVGYYSVEVWGGATFDVCLRYLREDPWERLKTIKSLIKQTPLQMLLRGQNIVGYRNYADDVLKAFIEKSAEYGIKIFRIFDCLDDVRNLERAIVFAKSIGAHVQGSICYTISPVHTIEWYVDCARRQYDLGIDSLNIKDMAGILAPKTAYDLICELKNVLGNIPIHLHCHSSSGMATATYLKAIEAGVDVVDCAVAPLAMYISQPAVETMIAILNNLGYTINLRLDLIEKIAEHFEEVGRKRAVPRQKLAMIDTSATIHQLPGGMASNLIKQLEEQNALDRFDEVLRELPKVREDLGWPPLVTPTSQLVGTQAVLNVLYGRYKIIPQEVRQYVLGYYGKPPGEISKFILDEVLKEGKKRIECRPADLLSPELPQAQKSLPKDLTVNTEDDLISFALFPQEALEFFKYRKKLKENPQKIPTEAEQNHKTAEKPIPKTKQPTFENLRKLTEKLINTAAQSNLSEFEIKFDNKRAYIKRSNNILASLPSNNISTFPSTIETQTIAQENDTYYKITSPLSGTFYLTSSPNAPPYVEVGDVIEINQIICLIEAMKLFNEIRSPVRGKIVKIIPQNSQRVSKGDILFLVDTTITEK